MIDPDLHHKYQPQKAPAEPINLLRAHFAALAQIVRDACPPGRERSLAETNLEQASMWAIKAITHERP